MSPARISCSVIALASLGVCGAGDCASAAPAPNASANTRAAGLRVDMLDLPLAVDPPARDAVVVLVGEGERRRDRRLGFAPCRHELGTQRLHVAGLVPGAAFPDRRLAAPAPPHHERG